jgi:phosphatidylserine/phosphatidylglycerophosphate/cardiolipin synthase-like enzyme
VFRLALTLAFGAISPGQPAASVPTAAAIAVCFAPEEDCAAFAVRAIDNAEREILVAAYRLTVGSGIVGALIRAKERGVDAHGLGLEVLWRNSPARGGSPGAAREPVGIDGRAGACPSPSLRR